MGSFLKFLKPYLLELIDIEKVKGALIFIVTLIVIGIYDTNIDGYDCYINKKYFDGSYLCVVYDYGNIINSLLTMFDKKDLTEIDEVIMIIILFFVGEIIVSLNNVIYMGLNYHNLKKYDSEILFKPDVSLLSAFLAILLSFAFIINTDFKIILLIISTVYVIYLCFFKYLNIKKLSEINAKSNIDEDNNIIEIKNNESNIGNLKKNLNKTMHNLKNEK